MRYKNLRYFFTDFNTRAMETIKVYNTYFTSKIRTFIDNNAT